MDVLSDVLSKLKLTSALYFRTQFTGQWSIRVPDYESVARFHYVHRGSCIVRIKLDGEAIQLSQGDLIIITRGASHTLFSSMETEKPIVPLEQVLAETGFSGSGTLVYGAEGAIQETQLVCGHFSFDPNAHHPLLDALPALIHIKDYGVEAANWMESTLKVIGAEAGRDNMGSDLIALKMSEIIFAQALRHYLESGDSNEPVLAAFANKRMALALKAIHDDASYPWNLNDLAKIAGLSRTAFATMFASYMSTTPLVYLTQWRMQIARQRLLETQDPIIAIAESVGYQSEAAFGRVFKRYFDIAPASYRRKND